MNAETPSPAATDSTGSDLPDSNTAETGSGKVLLVVFWVWAGLLVVATVAQLLGLDAVLDVLDVKRWFAR